MLWKKGPATATTIGDINSNPDFSQNGIGARDAVDLIDRLGSFFGKSKSLDGTITVYRPGQTGQIISLDALTSAPQPISNKGQEDGLLIYNPQPAK